MSVQKRAEKTNPKPNWLEVAETEPIEREWQLGTALLLSGIILGTFDVLFGVVFIPSDLRAGHSFWIDIATIETAITIVLIVSGFIVKWHASLERAQARK